MLSDLQFWQRVKNLEGKTVYTLSRKKPNRIVRVTDTYVEIEGRGSRIGFGGERVLYNNYHILHRDGFLIRSTEGNGRGPYVIPPIIAEAVPEEVDEGFEGLELRVNK